MSVVQVILTASQTRQYAGLAVGSVDAAFDEARAIVPAEGSVGLLHVRLQAANHMALAVIQGHRLEPGDEFFHDFADAGDRGIADAPVVQLGFAQALGQVEFTGGPDRPGVHFLHCLQRRHTPTAEFAGDGPVQRTGAAVADNARMNDHHGTLVVAP